MPRSRNVAAERAGRLLLHVNPQSELIRLPFDVIQNQNARVWEQGLRMAWGRCHRSPKLKTFPTPPVLSRFAPNPRKSPVESIKIRHRRYHPVPYLNKCLGQDHGFVKKRIAASLWFRSVDEALRTVAARLVGCAHTSPPDTPPGVPQTHFSCDVWELQWGGLLFDRHESPLTRRYVVYYCSGV